MKKTSTVETLYNSYKKNHPNTKKTLADFRQMLDHHAKQVVSQHAASDHHLEKGNTLRGIQHAQVAMQHLNRLKKLTGDKSMHTNKFVPYLKKHERSRGKYKADAESLKPVFTHSKPGRPNKVGGLIARLEMKLAAKLTEEQKMILEYLANPVHGEHKSVIPGGHRQQDLNALASRNLITDEGDYSYRITDDGKALLKL
jgi:hypothetical protein